jgi:hypothetical protein
VRVHFLTLSYTPGSMRCDSWASLLACTLVSPCISHEPKVRVMTTKIVASLEMLNPTNVHTLKSFIKLCNYYKIYVLEFNIIAHPLYALLKKDVAWTWNEEA